MPYAGATLPGSRHGEALSAAVEARRGAYVAANPASLARFRRAAAVMPGGNTRTVLHYDPFPLGIAQAAGCTLTDLDGHAYADFLGEYTAGLFGHSHPTIRAAVIAALDRGINIGGPGEMEERLARLVCERFPSIERVRFTNSGTEANLLALAAARVHTGRERILVFDAGYHGGVLSFADGGGALNVPHRFIVAPYNDLEATRGLVREHGDDLAAIVVEPMLGSGGCIAGTGEFLQMLRDEADRSGALLVFDEVMTSRLGAAGRQGELGIRPDLTTLGKYIGGGMSFGAFGGRAEVMARFDPTCSDALAHAGTFNNNALTMAAGVAALGEIYTPAVAVAHTARGDRLRERLNGLAREAGVPVSWCGLGSLMNIHLTDQPRPRTGSPGGPAELGLELFFFDMLAAGIYLARRGFIALSLALGEAEEIRLEGAFAEFLRTRGEQLAAAGIGSD